MRYVFDIGDTGGKNVKLAWDLEGENLPDLLSAHAVKNQFLCGKLWRFILSASYLTSCKHGGLGKLLTEVVWQGGYIGMSLTMCLWCMHRGRLPRWLRIMIHGKRRTTSEFL